MQTNNGREMTAKRQLESSVHKLQVEVDGMLLGKASMAKLGTKVGEPRKADKKGFLLYLYILYFSCFM